MTERERDPLKDIKKLARSTDGLCPTDDFVDVIMAQIEPSSAATVFANATRETSNLTPSDDFVASVMQSVNPTSQGKPTAVSGWQTDVVRFARVALMGAAAAAALSLWLSNQAQSSFDAAVLGDVASIEVDE